MNTLIKVAWRNIWRNKARSLIIITALIIGVIGAIFSAAVRLGVEQQQFKDTVEHQISHIQIHHPEFIANPEARYRISEGLQMAEEIRNRPDVMITSPRTVFDGMGASANLTTGIRIKGIDPQREAETTGLDQLIEKGTYFSERGRLPSVIIGKELAENLNSDVGSRIVLTFQDIEGEIISASFRVEGLYRIADRAFEKRTVFVDAKEINQLIGDADAVSEIAVVLNDLDKYRSVASELQTAYSDAKVRHWADIVPFLYFSLEFLERNLIWIFGLIILGVSFGLLNTILMSVLERVRELGVLMAIGMKKAKVFSMVVLETTMLSIIGGFIGLVLSFGLVQYLSSQGLDLSGVGGEGLGEFGYAAVIYPELTLGMYFQLGFLIIVFAIIAALYPAWKAIRLVPAEAVRQE